MSDLVQVRRSVDKLSQAKHRCLACFGSERHQFQLTQRLPDAQLYAFEERHGITLPAQYRAFLRYGGGSGAGPCYGLYPLDEWNDFAAMVLDGPAP
jgi:hypothetical protein